MVLTPYDLLVIKPSAYISSLCYSTLRLEPWSTCSIGCVYCYAQWYRGPHGAPQPQPEALRYFARLARRLSRARLPPPYFRLATLTEPLQDPEPHLRISYRLASTALRYETPLVINTKLPSRLLREDWLALLGEMADKRLVLVQVSIAYDDKVSVLVEPGAEPPSKRLEAIKELAKHHIPVAVRIQPLTPGFERIHTRLATEAIERGAGLVIGESIRLSPREAEILEKLINLDTRGWEPYQLHQVPGKTGLIHPPRHWREEMHKTLHALAEARNTPYHACKDTLSTHRIPGDCCGATLYTLTAIRVTLHEATLYHMEHGEWPTIEQLCGYAKTLSDTYTCGRDTRHYPNPVSKALRAHEARLARILERLRDPRKRAEYEKVVPRRLAPNTSIQPQQL